LSGYGLLHPRVRQEPRQHPVGQTERSQPSRLTTHLRGEWRRGEQLTLSHNSGQEIAIIEKNPVIEGQLGAEELQEFVDEVPHYKPESAATWLQRYLPTVKVIYAFQFLKGTDVNDGWSHLHRLHSAVWNHAGGILQADGEGFSDEGGFTILWQFSDGVNGEWNMGVLKDGDWVHFQMNLGNEQHRKAFFSGQVPDGAKLL
jgi:hypothetical protein